MTMVDMPKTGRPVSTAYLSDGKGHTILLSDEEYERAKSAVMSMAGEATEHITTGDAAKILGVSRRTVMRMLDAGLIPYVRLGNQSYRYMRLDDVLEYKKESTHARSKAMDDVHEIMDSAVVSDSELSDYVHQLG